MEKDLKNYWGYISGYEDVSYIKEYIRSLTDFNEVIFRNLGKNLTASQLGDIILVLADEMPEFKFRAYIDNENEYPTILVYTMEKK